MQRGILEIRRFRACLLIPGSQNTEERKKTTTSGQTGTKGTLVIVLQLAVTPGLGFVAFMRLCEKS